MITGKDVLYSPILNRSWHEDWMYLKMYVDPTKYKPRVYIYKPKDRHYHIAVRGEEQPFKELMNNPPVIDETYKTVAQAVEAALALANAMGLKPEGKEKIDDK